MAQAEGAQHLRAGLAVTSTAQCVAQCPLLPLLVPCKHRGSPGTGAQFKQFKLVQR